MADPGWLAGPDQVSSGQWSWALRSQTADPDLPLGGAVDNGREAAVLESWRHPILDEPLLLAQAKPEGGAARGDPAICAEFEKNVDADLGEMTRAGCKPTLAQMSALMDNPLGSVAMLFTQIDLFKMENPLNGQEANKWNYMGIAQFPKKLGPNVPNGGQEDDPREELKKNCSPPQHRPHTIC